jgi:hypothetical protein
MILKLATHDMYPVYKTADWTTDSGTVCDIPEELWDKYIEAKGEFYTYLEKLEEVVLSQHKFGLQ